MIKAPHTTKPNDSDSSKTRAEENGRERPTGGGGGARDKEQRGTETRAGESSATEWGKKRAGDNAGWDGGGAEKYGRRERAGSTKGPTHECGCRWQQDRSQQKSRWSGNARDSGATATSSRGEWLAG